MAVHDGLTGVYNRSYLEMALERASKELRRSGGKVSIIFLDVDDLKGTNDQLGHQAGDRLLRELAALLGTCCRDADIVARYGGEEFAVVMPETDAKGALVIAERIRERVQSEVFVTEQGPLKVTLSLGISTFPDSSPEKQPLIDLADQCLYFAKRHGRNQSVVVAQLHGGKERVGS
jgi:diguanylate cyclase (GGDEF)-like protein